MIHTLALMSNLSIWYVHNPSTNQMPHHRVVWISLIGHSECIYLFNSFVKFCGVWLLYDSADNHLLSSWIVTIVMMGPKHLDLAIISSPICLSFVSICMQTLPCNNPVYGQLVDIADFGGSSFIWYPILTCCPDDYIANILWVQLSVCKLSSASLFRCCFRCRSFLIPFFSSCVKNYSDAFFPIM
jgi:hypothetical protein